MEVEGVPRRPLTARNELTGIVGISASPAQTSPVPRSPMACQPGLGIAGDRCADRTTEIVWLDKSARCCGPLAPLLKSGSPFFLSAPSSLRLKSGWPRPLRKSGWPRPLRFVSRSGWPRPLRSEEWLAPSSWAPSSWLSEEWLAPCSLAPCSLPLRVAGPLLPLLP